MVRQRHPDACAAAARHVAGRGPARQAARLQDRHLVRVSRCLGGRVRPAGDDRGVGRAAGRHADARPQRPDDGGAGAVQDRRPAWPRASSRCSLRLGVLRVGRRDLPPALRRLDPAPHETGAGRDAGGPKILYPPDGAVVAWDGAALPLEATGGSGPMRWLVDGRPLPLATPRRPLYWRPDEPASSGSPSSTPAAAAPGHRAARAVSVYDLRPLRWRIGDARNAVAMTGFLRLDRNRPPADRPVSSSTRNWRRTREHGPQRQARIAADLILLHS